MIEVILILGLLFVLGVVILLHIGATADLPFIRETTNTEPDPSAHPLFLTIETILLLVIVYLCKNIS